MSAWTRRTSMGRKVTCSPGLPTSVAYCLALHTEAELVSLMLTYLLLTLTFE